MSIDKSNLTYKKTSFLTGVNSDYIEEYYALYLQNPKLLTINNQQFLKFRWLGECLSIWQFSG